MIEKYKDRLKEILSDEKVVKRRSTKRRSTKRRSTKRRSAKKRGMLFGGELQIDSVDELSNVPEEELKRVAQKMKFKKQNNMEEIKDEIKGMIENRNEDKASADKLKTLGVLYKLKQHYDKEKNRDDFVLNSNLGVLSEYWKPSYKADEYIEKANNQLDKSLNQRVAEAKETLPARPLRPDEKQQIIQMWGKLPKPEQKFINEHEKDLTPEEMRELINNVYDYYQTHPQSKPGDAFSNALSEAGMMENSNKLVAKKYYDSINKRNVNKLVNSGTKDPEAEVLFSKQSAPKRESLSQMVKRMSGFRNDVRLPPNALEDISAGDPKTPEAALAKAKAAARGSVRRPGDDDDNYV